MKVSSYVLAFGALLVACSKPEGGQAQPTASASAATSASGKPAASAGASAAPSAQRATGQASTYSGSYSVAPAKYYVSEAKDFASVKQVKDDPSKHVGDGALTVSVDAEGKVTGTVDTGPASPGVIDGTLLGQEIRGNIRRKDPSDNGLTGVFAASVSGDSATGTLSLAESNAAIVRDGKLTLKRK